MDAVKRDWQWSDRFLPEIRRIVGPHLLEPAPLEVDRHQATDLIVLRARSLMIACRVRRPVSRPEYLRQFTLRSRRGSGVKTEYDKIVDGFGDILFYGIAAAAAAARAATLERWYLIDLHAFRAHLIRNPERIVTAELGNGDGTGFRWFDVESFPQDPPILIATNQPNRRVS